MLAISNAKLPITVVGIYTEFSEQTRPFKQTVQIRGENRSRKNAFYF